VLLDLHSFRGDGDPFVLVGPENNDGELEPFQHAELERGLALRLGVKRMVDGWLGTYAQGVAARRQRLQQLLAQGAAVDARQLLNADPMFGVGTTEYMRSVGGAALTLECGSHEDPQAPEVAYQAIHRALAHLGLIAAPDPQPQASMEALSIYAVVDKLDDNDRFSRAWASFDPLAHGECIGWRHDGSEVVAQSDGRIIFPDANASAGEEWFYLTRPNARA
jgi:hypothetical protein